MLGLWAVLYTDCWTEKPSLWLQANYSACGSRLWNAASNSSCRLCACIRAFHCSIPFAREEIRVHECIWHLNTIWPVTRSTYCSCVLLFTLSQTWFCLGMSVFAYEVLAFWVSALMSFDSVKGFFKVVQALFLQLKMSFITYLKMRSQGVVKQCFTTFSQLMKSKVCSSQNNVNPKHYYKAVIF